MSASQISPRSCNKSVRSTQARSRHEERIALAEESNESVRWTCRGFFFFQAEDGIRDIGVTGVQTCALPILASLVGQAISGVADFNAQQVTNGLEPVGLLDYLTSSSFMVDVMENWQSEYLQFFLFIFATVWLVQKGSTESKEPGQEGTESDEEQRIGRHADADSPAWAKVGGWRTAVFARSLGLVMGVLFLLTWSASAVAGWAAFNSEQLGQRQD